MPICPTIHCSQTEIDYFVRKSLNLLFNRVMSSKYNPPSPSAWLYNVYFNNCMN